MKERLKEEPINTSEGSKDQSGRRHYSDKGGHWLRSEYWKAYRLLSASAPNFRSAICVPIPIENTWRARRFMPRYGVNDGRR